MEKKYIVPASTLLAGTLIWVIFLLVYSKDEVTLMSEVVLGLISGGLLLFSAFRCRKVGGPKGGNIFRAGLLLIMAVLTYWLIGTNAAVLMLAASVAVLFLVLKKSELSKTAEV